MLQRKSARPQPRGDRRRRPIALARGHLYPEGEGDDLIAAIAAHFGVAADRIRLGPGSDPLVMSAVLAFAGPGDEVVFSARGYARYARNALIAGATPVAAPDRDFRADPRGDAGGGDAAHPAGDDRQSG